MPANHPAPQSHDTLITPARPASATDVPATGRRPAPRCAEHALACLPHTPAAGAAAACYPADAYWPLPDA